MSGDKVLRRNPQSAPRWWVDERGHAWLNFEMLREQPMTDDDYKAMMSVVDRRVSQHKPA